MTHTPDRLDDTFDAVLHLLDRQLLDIEGRMLGCADDIELAEDDDALVLTAVLTGTTALLHRLGGGLGGWLVTAHARLRPQEPDRTRPWRVPMIRVARVDSAIHLAVEREGCLEHDQDGLRLGTLTGMQAYDERGSSMGRVIDVRCRPDDERLVVTDLLVGRGGAGSMLGYDRHEEQGPWIIGALVRWWHRGMRVVPLRACRIDWENRKVTITERRSDASAGTQG